MHLDDHIIGDFISAGATLLGVIITQSISYYKTKSATTQAITANTTAVTSSILAQEDRVVASITDVKGAAENNGNAIAQVREFVKGYTVGKSE